MPHAPSGRTVLRVHIALRDGTRIIRSTGTRDARTARQMETMLDDLGHRGAQAWDILARLDARTLDLPTLYAEWVAAKRSVPKLRDRLKDATLAEQVEPFLTWYEGTVAPLTFRQARVYLGRLLTQFTRASDLTPSALEKWVGTLPTGDASKLKHIAAVAEFCAYLKRHELLERNPAREMVRPSQPKPRERYLDTADAVRLADAQPEPFRSLSAMLAGTALDVTVALTLRKRDVDLADWTIRLLRPKSGSQVRAVVAEWARPYLTRAMAGKMPDARLFPTSRSEAWRQHVKACTALGIADYTMKDHRHTWAVRWARAGGSPQTAALQLGHADGGALFLRLYGRYLPTVDEQARFERMAAMLDGVRDSVRTAS